MYGYDGIRSERVRMSGNVYIIAGPNGAGKTTFAREFLPLYAECRDFINADLIAQGIAPLAPQTAAFRAGRLMLEQIGLSARRGEDFGFETTLSGLAHLALIRDLKRRGYATHLFYLWIPSADLALSRVRARVAGGGHDVPEAVVRRRFQRSISNFLHRYRAAVDHWILFDNARERPEVMAIFADRKLHIMEGKAYQQFVARCGGIR